MNESLGQLRMMESSTVHHNQHSNHMQTQDTSPAVTGGVQ